MGLLDISNNISSGDFTETEFTKISRELSEARKKNNYLTNQINNLLHYLSEERKEREKLEARINMHPKSGLGNHNKMDEDLENFFNEYSHRMEQHSGSLIIVKLDENFGIITKTLKAAISEWIIYQISSRLKEKNPPGTPIYHIRDDEFVILLEEYGEYGQIKNHLNKLIKELSKPHIFSGYHITINCYIGIAVFPKDGTSKSTLLNHADIALSYSKSNKRKYSFYTPKMKEEVVEKMELQNSIIKALEEQSLHEIDKQFFINMQPIVSVNGFNREGLPLIDKIDAEALIRWRHSEKGVISPGAFIPVAEETGLIIIIGKWVLYSAASIIEKWSEMNIESKLSINASPRQFNDNDLIESVHRITKFNKIDPSKLQIEITENSFLDDPEEAVKKINKLKDLGVGIAIDDFGTGFSSINYLRKLPVDVVKIDRSFITKIETSHRYRSIVKAIIAMSEELGMSNVVEGVENINQLKILYDFGIKNFQGFYFSKALGMDDFAQFYKEKIKG